MNSAEDLHHRASELVEAGRMFQTAASGKGSSEAAPESLADVEETLQLLSTAWYRIAADAASQAPATPHSRERGARLISTLHDVAAAFGRCARVCRDGRATVTPIVATCVTAETPDHGGRDELAWFESRELPRRVA